jgi:hypothetical protein
MIAGAPGSYKSVFALNMLALWAGHGITQLYCSADSDEFTVAKRMASMLTGESTDQVEKTMANDRAKYAGVLRHLDPARFVFTPMNIDSIDTHMRAFESMYGAFPDVVFVDNLINAVDDPTDWGGMIRLLRDLDVLAREARSHVCVLHHASEGWSMNNPGKPPPSYAIQGKVNQIPRLILTLGAEGRSLGLACVKNTNGPQSPQARDVIGFGVAPSLRVTELYSQPVMSA